MAKPRRRQPQRPVHQDLPWRRWYQVVAANHLRDALGCVIHHDRQLVRRGSRRFPYDEIAAHRAQVERYRTAKTVFEGDDLVAGAQAPCIGAIAESKGIGGAAVGTGAWIDGPFV